jgi:hypothetical protein
MINNRLKERGVLDAPTKSDAVAARDTSDASARSTSESITAWLDIAISLCRLNEREAASLREELESHLSERVNDLLVTGHNEQQSMRTAIAELGDAARFAQQYRSNRNEPTRRRIMNGLLISSVGAALALSVTAVTLNQPAPGPNVYPSGTAYAVSKPIGDLVAFSFTDETIQSVLEQIGGAVAERAYVNPFGDWNTPLDTKITLNIGKVPLSHGLLLLNEILGDSRWNPIEYRVREGLIEFGPRSLFDDRERVLVSYDTEEDLRPDVSVEDLAEAIISLVGTDSWTDNGGETASIHVVGSLLFVDAPPRLHDGVEWIIGQLSEESREDAMLDSLPQDLTRQSPSQDLTLDALPSGE